VVSGGHTLLVTIESFGRYRLLDRPQDDAAGEAFDKVGKLLGSRIPADRMSTAWRLRRCQRKISAQHDRFG